MINVEILPRQTCSHNFKPDTMLHKPSHRNCHQRALWVAGEADSTPVGLTPSVG